MGWLDQPLSLGGTLMNRGPAKSTPRNVNGGASSTRNDGSGGGGGAP